MLKQKKQNWLVGGRIDLNTGENSTHIGFSPGAGIFVIDNFAIGANFLIDYNKTGDVKATDFGVGPFFRYYFLKGMVKPLIHASVNYLSSKYKSPLFQPPIMALTFLRRVALPHFSMKM